MTKMSHTPQNHHPQRQLQPRHLQYVQESLQHLVVGQEGELHKGHHKDGLDKRKINSPPWELSENAHVNLPSSCLTKHLDW